MSVLATIGKVIGGLVILAAVAVVYMTWLDSRKDKTFAACNLDYLNNRPDEQDGSKKGEYLQACMGAKGYKTITTKYCLLPIDFAYTTVCYETGFFP